MITRKLGSVLRGNATPFQLFAACVLGSLLGFAPAFLQAPALYGLLIGVLLVVNANIGLALLLAGVARILSWLAAPVSFQIGRFLLDGPTAGVARGVVNAPVLAWCGFQYYGVSGGMVLALAFGCSTGWLAARGVNGFRRRMVRAAQSESRWREMSSKPWARATAWLFFGGTGKRTWDEKLERRVGNPIRTWGAVLVLLVTVGGGLGHGAFVAPLARRGLQTSLAQANGATVDVGGVAVDLSEGRFAVSELALADPEELSTDLFRAAQLEADVDQVDFLRRRVHVAKLVVSEAASGAQRETDGVRVTPAATKVYEQAREKAPDPGDLEDLSLEDVLKQAEAWKQRLAQARRWMDRLSGSGKRKPGGAHAPAEAEERESFSERLRREVREKGWLTVEAGHLLDQAPTFRLSDLSVEGLTLAWLPDRVFDLKGTELSTHPWLLDSPPKLSLASRDGAIAFEVDLAPVSKDGGNGALRMHWKGLSVDDALARLELGGKAPLSGGTLDLSIDGAWSDGEIGWIDLPLKVTVRDTTLTMEGVEETELEKLVLPIGLSGPIDSPRVRFDASDFTDALADAGRDELARKVRGKLGDELEEAGIELPEELEDVEKGARDLLDGVLGGGRKEGGGGR